MLWETVIDEEFEKYGALGVKGEYSGANGMAELLCNVVKHFDTSLFTFRHCILDEFMVNNDVCNLLEVYPKFEPDLFSKIEKHKTSWNRNISHHGGEYKKYQILTQHEIDKIRKQFDDFKTVINMSPLYPIPSDTGRVILLKDGTLVAAESFGENVEITSVPISNCVTFNNPTVSIGPLRATVLKKAFPFCGFGGFVRIETNNTHKNKVNCEMRIQSSTSIVLVSTRHIHVQEPIVCWKSIFSESKYRDSGYLLSKDQMLEPLLQMMIGKENSDADFIDARVI